MRRFHTLKPGNSGLHSLGICLCIFLSGGPNQPFTNPLLPSGPDPWVIQQDTTYYYMNTLGNRLAIRATGRMSSLSSAVPVTIWVPPAGGPYSKEIWAPELHLFNSRWYVYFAADDGKNANHRIYALEHDGPDPLSAGLGLLTLRPGGNPLEPAAWSKSLTPVFSTAAASGAYAPGHNGFFVSRDGKENWLIYHANSRAAQGCGSSRSPRMQSFSWSNTGSPIFGVPARIDSSMRKPGGE